MNLAEWQERLKSHFDELKRSRSLGAGYKPIFALEHGLTTDETKKLEIAVKTHIAAQPPSLDHALPWTVYAAELGYRYEGHEYWQSFNEETPGWQIFGQRTWLRDCFINFHTQFMGAKPSGAWANNFSIICWPITHAILPKDLQVQLAQILYQMRGSFTADLLASPQALGQRIAANSWETSARFRHFAQETMLVGQIATALLLERTDAPILQNTLTRIRQDLAEAQNARDWLRNAQETAQQRVNFRGLSPSGEEGQTSAEKQTRNRSFALGIAPNLILRPSNEDDWQVRLEIPELSGVLARHPEFREILSESRCIVLGSTGRPLARGALLHGSQQVTLQSWPPPNDPLIRFESKASADLEELLRAECSFRPGSQWLFRIGSDGLAFELRSNKVRAGQRYILVSLQKVSEDLAGMEPVNTSCKEVHALQFEVPSTVTEDWTDKLKSVGLTHVRNMSVWPAGLAAANWNGEGRAEWLTTEKPCIGIKADYEVERVKVTLGSGEENQLETSFPKAGEAVFVELPFLTAGVHSLAISSLSRELGAEGQTGYLDIVVREPRAWSARARSQGALQVIVEPSSPTLEQLWEGKVSIEVQGPIGRKITPSIGLFARRGTTPSFQKQLPQVPIPIHAKTWNKFFEKHVLETGIFDTHYDLSYSCRLEFSAGELGVLALSCPRDFVPLRWAVRPQDKRFELKLLDDSGLETSPKVFKFEFNTPDRSTQLVSSDFSEFSPIPEQGGMYFAQTGEWKSAVILGPASKILTPQELGITTSVHKLEKSAISLAGLISTLEIWSGARFSGLLAALRQKKVNAALRREIFACIAGETWVVAEDEFDVGGNSRSLEVLKDTISNKSPGTSLAAKVFMDYKSYAELETTGRVARFSMSAKRLLQITTNQEIQRSLTGDLGREDWIFEFAWRLASSPESIRAWAGSNFERGMVQIFQAPVLLRSARFLILANDGIEFGESSPNSSIAQGRVWE